MPQGEYMIKWNELSPEIQEQRLSLQSALEEQMLYDGSNKYWDEYSRACDEGIPEQQLLDSVVFQLAPVYQEWIDNISKNRKTPDWVHPLLTLGAAKMADLTVRCVIRMWLKASMFGFGRDDIKSTPPLAQHVARTISKEAIHIIAYQTAKETFKDDWRKQSKFIKNWTEKRCIAFTKKMLQIPRMTLKQRDDFGHHMIRIAELSSVIHTFRDKYPHGKNQWRNKLFVTLDDSILKDIHNKHKFLENTTLLYRPMVCPPVDHTLERSGGYLHHWIRKEVVHRYSSDYITEERKINQQYSEPSQKVLDATNAMQRTEWTINTRVFDVMNSLFKNNTRLCNLPAYSFDAFSFGDEYPKDSGKQEQAIWCQRREEAWSDWFKEEQKRGRMLVRLQLAINLTLNGFFYMPMTLDFRGRGYTTCELLSCQGSDFDRGLIMFANAVPQTERGRYWMKIHIANLFDIDKVSFSDRVKWFDDNQEMLKRINEDPYQNREWIDDAVKKNKSFQRIAAVFDYFRKDGMTQVPVQMDGACNGSQHWAAIMRDEDLAKLVNIIPNEVPQDLYQYVANKSTEHLNDNKENPWYKKFLEYWKGNLDRKITKRSTMCDAYGLTFYGIQKYMKLEGHVDWVPHETQAGAIVELARAVQAGLGSALESANHGKEYLKDITNMISTMGHHLTYTVPSGFKVVHNYTKIRKRRSLAALFNNKELIFWEDAGDLDAKKAEQGIPPNYIHSLDASHLVCTVFILYNMGINSFSMIHDSYGCHAPFVDDMIKITKEQFYEMHQVNLLEELKNQIEERYRIRLPNPPVTGQLRIKSVLESDYFFS